MRTVLVVLTVMAVAFGVAACGGDDDDTTPAPADKSKVQVTLNEYTMALDKTAVPPGAVTFTVRNGGQMTHQFKVIATDLDADSLPTKEDGSVDEAALGDAVLGTIAEVPPGGSQDITIKVKAGGYVLFSNAARTEGAAALADYAEGMRAAFRVE